MKDSFITFPEEKVESDVEMSQYIRSASLQQGLLVLPQSQVCKAQTASCRATQLFLLSYRIRRAHYLGHWKNTQAQLLL